jgi:hypothetical protein
MNNIIDNELNLRIKENKQLIIYNASTNQSLHYAYLITADKSIISNNDIIYKIYKDHDDLYLEFINQFSVNKKYFNIIEYINNFINDIMKYYDNINNIINDNYNFIKWSNHSSRRSYNNEINQFINEIDYLNYIKFLKYYDYIINSLISNRDILQLINSYDFNNKQWLYFKRKIKCINDFINNIHMNQSNIINFVDDCINNNNIYIKGDRLHQMTIIIISNTKSQYDLTYIKKFNGYYNHKNNKFNFK